MAYRSRNVNFFILPDSLVLANLIYHGFFDFQFQAGLVYLQDSDTWVNVNDYMNRRKPLNIRNGGFAADYV